MYPTLASPCVITQLLSTSCSWPPGQGSQDLVSRRRGGSGEGSRFQDSNRVSSVKLDWGSRRYQIFFLPFCPRRCSSVRCQCGEWGDSGADRNNPNKGKTFCNKNVSSQMRFVANAKSFVQILGKSKTVPNILCGERNSDFSLNWTGAFLGKQENVD